jgi:cAMP-dependent protein kinase regulator
MSCCCPIGRPPAKPPPTSARVVSVKKEERGSASLIKEKYQDTGAPPPLAKKASSVKRISATQGRRVAVRVEDDGEDAAAPFPVVPKSAEIRFQILAAINRSELLQDLSREQSDLLVNAAIEVACEAEQTVIEQGAPGDHFYMVQSGSYDVYVRASDDATQGAALKRYFSGEAFGELALLYNSPRAATVVCHEAGTLWALDRKVFRHVMRQTGRQFNESTGEFLKTVGFLSKLSDAERQRLAWAFDEKTYEDGEYVVEIGEPADALYVIKSGAVVCHQGRLSTAGDVPVENVMVELGVGQARNSAQFGAILERTLGRAIL